MTARHTTKTCRHCRNRYPNVTRYGDPLGITPPGNPRLPWDPIQTELVRRHGAPVSNHRAELILGHHHDMIGRWRHIGVEVHTADTIAIRLGVHPATLWGDQWWGISFHECPIVGEQATA